MKTNEAIKAKGQRVTSAKGEPKYTGELLVVTRISRSWYGEIACEDGEKRRYRVKWLKLRPLPLSS